MCPALITLPRTKACLPVGMARGSGEGAADLNRRSCPYA